MAERSDLARTVLIPLHTFNPKALEGARVPLRSSPVVHRAEWCIDRLVLTFNDTDSRASIDTIRAETLNLGLALEPTDPDTARLIDRRIAEAIFAPDPGDAHPDRPPVVAVLGCAGETWHITAIDADGLTSVRVISRPKSDRWPMLHGLEAIPENLPEARRRLLQAFYPPVTP